MGDLKWTPATGSSPHHGPKGGGEVPGDDPEHPEQELYTVPRFSAGESGRSCYLLGRRLAAVTVRPGGVALEIRSLEGSLELQVHGPFRFSSEAGSWAMDPDHPADLAPLLGRISSGVERIRVDLKGNLKVSFTDDDGRLLVPGNAFRPTWDIQGAGDLEAVRPFFRAV